MKAVLAGVLAAVATLACAATAMANPHKLFLSSAVENASLSQVTLPLYRGTSGAQRLWFMVTDASSKDWAKRLGVNYAPRLGLARDTEAVQHVTWNGDGTLNFPGTVDFAPVRVFNPDPAGYGPGETGLPVGAGTTYGAVGDAAYSPLAQLPDGTILNASHVLNASGRADKASNLRLDGIVGSVTWEETAGLFEGHSIHYISVDGSVPPAAIVEDVTLAPRLAFAPADVPAAENLDASKSARVGIIAFTNGQNGLGNPNRQGLGSTFLDAASVPGATGVATVPPPVPLNIIQAVPKAGPNSLYSPLWDVHLTRWVPSLVPYGRRLRQTSFESVQALAAAGLVTNPLGGAWGPSGPVANCPIISSDGPHDLVIPQPN